MLLLLRTLLETSTPPVEPEGAVVAIRPRRLAQRPGLTKENDEAVLLLLHIL